MVLDALIKENDETPVALQLVELLSIGDSHLLTPTTSIFSILYIYRADDALPSSTAANRS